MNNNDLLSVIIPIYKVQPYLDRCVQSVVDQTYTNLEIILVDDGSPDRCPAMCDVWAEKDCRVKVVHKINGGLSDARNAGMSIATGEYIAFVDSDDWLAPEMFERLHAAMRQDGSSIAACSVMMVWEDQTPDRLLTVRNNMILNRTMAQRSLLRDSLLKQPVWYKVYRREIIENICFEVGKYHEDVFWSYQAIGRAECVSIIDYVGYYYTQRTGSIMGAGYSLKRLDALEGRENWYHYIVLNFPELRQEALVRLWENCIYHGQMALKYLPKSECQEAFGVIYRLTKRHPLYKGDYFNLKMTRRMWLSMAKISIKYVCRFRNIMHVGA